MTRGLIDMIGRSFGRLTVQERAENCSQGKPRYVCSCACGGATVAKGDNLRGGQAISCGCIRSEKLRARAADLRARSLRKTGAHGSWRAMLARCYCVGNASYERYGALGIGVCEEWRDSFAAFHRDMGDRPPGKTLDRIRNEVGYEPGNCRWATPHEQALNRRPKGWRRLEEVR